MIIISVAGVETHRSVRKKFILTVGVASRSLQSRVNTVLVTVFTRKHLIICVEVLYSAERVTYLESEVGDSAQHSDYLEYIDRSTVFSLA